MTPEEFCMWLEKYLSTWVDELASTIRRQLRQVKLPIPDSDFYYLEKTHAAADPEKQVCSQP